MELNEPVIEIKDLKMNFGSKEVLKGVNLKVHKGEIIGYIGPNGAGKSTTVKIMLGIFGGYEGSIKIFGEDILKDDGTYKKRIGYVPEIAELYDSLTAKEYLNFVGQLYGMEPSDVECKSKKLMDILGIGHAYGSRISSYSKGMKQKVLIISSLLHNPDILFLDEPLSGLDANSVMIIKEILSMLSAKGKTIFYSSHIMDVVEKISSRIVLLNNGNVVADGSFNDLKDKCSEGTLEEIFNQLTGFKEHKSLAENFTSIIEGVE
ncbi:ABC transporter ATP-binding protein [Hathewaya massiliensis]|uniref:ABC transporter ATP-binding protein n=1 Tax=Hathewaya massiliensis TaxID=1964382 RepID=UPI0011595492|nr:ABC transporter ATP-binding protein [Hathewaya massiliensis]